MGKNNKTYRFITNALIFLLTFPLIILILWSFSKLWSWPNLLPQTMGLRAFKYIIDPRNNSLKVLGFSVWLSFIVTIVTLAISIPAAKALGVYEFKGKGFFKIFILAPIIVPPVAVTMGIHVTFIKIGLANTFLGVLLVHLIPCLPYAIRILTDVFEIIGEAMEMQARVLGANSIQTFLSVTLPLLGPGLISAGSLVFIVSFSQYFLTFLIGGGKIITFSMLMFPYIQSGDRMMASAYSIVFMSTTLLVLIIMEKVVKSYYKSDSYFYL